MVIYDGEKVVISVNRGNYKQLLEIAQNFDGEYLSANSSFMYPVTKQLVLKVVQITNESEWTNDFRKLADKARQFQPLTAPLDLPEDLFPFQKEDVTQMVRWNKNVLLGSGLGTGKTAVTSSYLRNMPHILPAVIVVPATVKINWERELHKWAPKLTTFVISGQTSWKDPSYISQLKGKDVIIINYNILGEPNKPAELIEKQRKADWEKAEKERKKHCELEGIEYKKIRFKPRLIPVIGWVDVLKEFNIKCVICDECQYIETPKTIRARAVRQLCEDVSIRKIFLSNTPYETRVSQFFNVLNLLYPEVFPDEWRFKFRYCDPKKNYFGWEFNGLSNGAELRSKILKFMIRRNIEDVLPELPESQRSVIYLDMDEKSRKYYDSLEDGLAEAKLAKKVNADGIQTNALAIQTELKKALTKIKLEPCIQFVEDLLSSENKVVLFVYYVDTYEALMKHFGKMAVGINGSVSADNRQTAIDKFQTDDGVRVFVGQIVAASAGITLTAAHTLVFLEFGQTVGQHIQAEGRIHRIGQKFHCISYYMIVQQTIDEDRMEGIEQHYKDLTGPMDGNLGSSATAMFDLDEAAVIKVKERYALRHKGVVLEYD